MRTYYAPWADDPARYPATALERHSAHCRTLNLPDETHPATIKPLLTPEAIAAGERAIEQLALMVAWGPEGYNAADLTTVKQNILTKGYRHYAFFGGRGGSKSHDAAEAAVELASLKYERVVCGREYMVSIKDSSHALIKAKILTSRWANQWHITDREMKNQVTGSLITFMGMNTNPDSARSLEGCTLFIGEEAEAFSDASLEVLIPTVRAPGSRLVWLWNPADHDSPVNQKFLVNCNEERAFVRCVLSDNNAYFYRTEMPAERRVSFVSHSTAKFRHIWRGALDMNPDLAVYSDWEVGRVEIPDDLEPRYGGDWGWVDPLAFLEFYIIEPDDPETEKGIIYVTAEVYGPGIPTKDIPGLLDEAMPLARFATITADSSEPKSIDGLNDAGFHVIGARKGPGSIRAGISFIQGYHLVVSPDCPQFASELTSYQWKRNRSGVIIKDPVDADNHACDALRYGVEDYNPPPRGGGVVMI